MKNLTSNYLDARGVRQEATGLNHNVDFARTAQRKRQRDVDLVETIVFQLRPGIQDRNGSAVDCGAQNAEHEPLFGCALR